MTIKHKDKHLENGMHPPLSYLFSGILYVIQVFSDSGET